VRRESFICEYTTRNTICDSGKNLHIIHLKLEDMHIFHKMTPFYKEKIPFPFNTQEFTIFYGAHFPRISNIKDRAVNEIIQNIIPIRK